LNYCLHPFGTGHPQHKDEGKRNNTHRGRCHSWFKFLGLDILGGQGWSLVGQIDVAAAMALDSKAALGLPILNIPTATDTTPCTDAGDELYPSSWDWILGMRRSDSQLMVG